jgi:hypothetical protein
MDADDREWGDAGKKPKAGGRLRDGGVAPPSEKSEDQLSGSLIFGKSCSALTFLPGRAS